MNYIKRTIILLILFVVVSPINSPKQLQIISIQKFKMTNSNYNLVILLLQKALSCGIFGHCSIAIDDKTILQIEGLATNQLHNPSNLLNIIMQVAK